KVTSLDKEINELVAQYHDIEGQIRVSSPGYAALTQPEPLDARAVQHLLDYDTVLLEYSLGKERSYVFVLTPNSLDSYQLPSRSEIEVAARRVYELLTARNRQQEVGSAADRKTTLANAEATYLDSATKLSEMVLGPVTKLIGRKQLLVVGDGALQYIPFAALPVPGDGPA